MRTPRKKQPELSHASSRLQPHQKNIRADEQRNTPFQSLVVLLGASALLSTSALASPSKTFFSQLSQQQLRQQQHRLFRRQQAQAEGDGENREPAPGGTVDLHNSEFCVDVSTFGDITFEEVPREKCDSTFEKRCETKTDQVGRLL